MGYNNAKNEKTNSKTERSTNSMLYSPTSVWLGNDAEAFLSVTTMGRMMTAASLWLSGPATSTAPDVSLILEG